MSVPRPAADAPPNLRGMLDLDATTTALLLIDLQHGVAGKANLAPRDGAIVVQRGARLAAACRAARATVVYVRTDLADLLKLPVDAPTQNAAAPTPPAEASQLVPAAGYDPATDLLVTKRQWGAFFGTGLERLLRDRGVTTTIIVGIATNYGVESTVRASQGLGFATVVVEDACASFSADAHAFAVQHVFPRIARVRSTADVLAALA